MHGLIYTCLHVAYRLIAQRCPRKLGGRVLRRLVGGTLFESCGTELVLESGTVPSPRVRVGNRVQIGANTRFMIGSRLTLEDDVLLAPEIVFIDINHESVDLNTPIKQQGWRTPRPIHVGAGAWIGYRAMILPGVSIGEGAIVGAGSVVTRSVPAYAIVAGNPAILRHYRTGAAPE